MAIIVYDLGRLCEAGSRYRCSFPQEPFGHIHFTHAGVYELKNLFLRCGYGGATNLREGGGPGAHGESIGDAIAQRDAGHRRQVM